MEQGTKMSTTSLIDIEQSEGLAKRFASIATSYFDEPQQAKTLAAQIPLENLFRMLQMFRYEAFSDEPRSGILRVEALTDQHRPSIDEGLWHHKLEAAIRAALGEVFSGISREDAVTQVQASLSWLATDKDAPDQVARQRSKTFLERFSAALD